MRNAMDEVRLVVQPTVSHYRAPLLKALLEQQVLPLSLLGRYANSEDRQSRNHIRSASAEILRRVDELKFREWRNLRWERGVVPSVLRGEYRAYVLEGRVYTVSTWLALALGRAKKTPVFLWGHGWKRPESGLKRTSRVAFYRLSSGLLVYGDRAKEYAVSVGLDADRIAVVGNSIYATQDLIDHAVPNRPSTEEDFTVIVSVRLTSRHRVDMLAEALALMSPGGRRTRVIVIGDGDQAETLRESFEQAGVAAKFVGAVYGAESLAPYYAVADVAVSPRASGLNIVQAMGFGRPVIAPEIDPTSGPESELVVDGHTGLQFPLDDIGALARALQSLRDDPDAAVRMGQAARERVLRTHTAEAHSAKIVQAVKGWLDRDR
ncbi:glycosyltransferase family 4 protein [Micrococcus sp. TA1]|uniref:glycosyltransferase family 4 protein n=1 Tax=Micrococcus sp. TA1 TaxID=681627 RepID=UPI00160F022C|nr:glycosyltransferase family 4 protein [Micrococcus sp. TA1]MBB5749579.1 glycosyltransferase involved in cell wall biosynthesis [Micrococcus sp. TA1]